MTILQKTLENEMDFSIHYGDIGFDVAVNIAVILWVSTLIALCYITKTLTSEE